jgi:hypothetical protein
MNFANTWLQAARDARRLGHHADVPGHYENAIKVARQRNPREYVIHTEYARYLASVGYPEQALLEYEAILLKNPPTAGTLRQEMARLR